MIPTNLTAITPYDGAFDESVAVNIGGDPRRTICIYNTVGADVDGIYSIYVKKGSDPWLRWGAVNLALTPKCYSIPDMEGINCFDKLLVIHDKFANGDQWFLTSSGNQGYE